MVKRNIFNILIVLTIFTIDRATKLIMIRAAETNYDLNILVTPFLNLNYYDSFSKAIQARRD